MTRRLRRAGGIVVGVWEIVQAIVVGGTRKGGGAWRSRDRVGGLHHRPLQAGRALVLDGLQWLWRLLRLLQGRRRRRWCLLLA